MRSFLIVISIFFIAACSKKSIPEATTSRPKETVSDTRSTDEQSFEKSILYFTNQYRKSKGLKPLSISVEAGTVALTHSKNMAAKKTGFGHAGFDARYKKLESLVGPIAAIGENVAFGQLDAKEVVDSWIKSAPHRKNLEGNFSFMGLGFAIDARGVPFYTQILLRKK